MKIRTISAGALPPLLLGGFLGGLFGGALGAGGGLIVVLTLEKVLKEQHLSGEPFSTAMCVMLPLSLFSAVLYALRGSISLQGFSPFLLPALLGGACGGLLMERVRRGTMKKAFAALIVVSGVILAVR